MGVVKTFLSIIILMSASLVAQAKSIDSINLDQVRSVTILIYDKNRERQDASKSKFRAAIFVNGHTKDHYITSYTVSPGKLIDNPEPGKEPELTPEGRFYAQPGRMYEEYVSNQFGGRILGIFETGKMPFSIFFFKGFALHGSASTVNGKPASKGCVRMRVRNAEKVFRLAQAAVRNTGNYKSVMIEIRDTESNYVRDYRPQPKN